MKVVLINHSDTLGGASVVTYRLMQALRKIGVDALMLVTKKATDDPNVHLAASKWRSRIPFLAEHIEIFARNGFSRADLFKASIATVGLPLSRHPLIESADIVALNWINQGMLSLDEIARIARFKPTVWTMHDMWNFTGICHHAFDCKLYLSRCHNCPLLNGCAGKSDLSTTTFDRKERCYDSAPISFVAVSNWLADCARRSHLLGDRQLSVIHNPFPIEALAATPTMSRSEAGLPEKGKLIVFCAARIDDPIKDLPTAIEALNGMSVTDATAIFIGEMRNPQALDQLKIPYRHLGPIYDKKRLNAIFAHSSIVLSSSTFETLPTTLIEGQAAGAIPVSFIHDGRNDIITDGETGYAADKNRSLSQALDLALTKPIDTDKLRNAAERYSNEKIAEQYLNLFKNLLSNR